MPVVIVRKGNFIVLVETCDEECQNDTNEEIDLQTIKFLKSELK